MFPDYPDRFAVSIVSSVIQKCVEDGAAKRLIGVFFSETLGIACHGVIAHRIGELLSSHVIFHHLLTPDWLTKLALAGVSPANPKGETGPSHLAVCRL